MVYEPKLDRQGFADRQSINNMRNRPSINYTRRDEVREMMRSPAGKNYGNMMDLQSQAIRQGGFESGDPRVDALKQARRQYNRQDKYNIADLMGYTPQEANEIYRQNSGVVREHAGSTYKDMYPISDMMHRVTGSGGLTGLLLNEAFGKTKKAGRNFFKDLRTMGSDILEGVGIGGAIDSNEATEEVLQNYADKTFNIPEEKTEEERIQEYLDEEQRKIDNFETNAYSDILDNAIESQWPSIEGEMYQPFDTGIDAREAYINAQNEYVAPVPATLGTPNPQLDFPVTERKEVIPPLVEVELLGSKDEIPSTQPFDTGIDAREAYLNAQNEYVDPPPVFSGNIRQDPHETDEYLKWLMADPLKFPPIGPHDPFDPSQNVFEDEKEYRAWLRRKRLGY